MLDERLDIPLLGACAAARPDWRFVLVGPIAKIDPATLPAAANLHYLGPKPYPSLPAYIAGWDVAVLPFARNDATRFISPTKTPEYLAAGKPVVSTSIQDVVRPYAEAGLAAIADTPERFVAAISAALASHGPQATAAADRFLSRHVLGRDMGTGRSPARRGVGQRLRVPRAGASSVVHTDGCVGRNVTSPR